MKYLVPPPSCFGEAEFRTRLKLILYNNACAVIRDTKTKNRTETSTILGDSQSKLVKRTEKMLMNPCLCSTQSLDFNL